jgi:hypothetical protein
MYQFLNRGKWQDHSWLGYPDRESTWGKKEDINPSIIAAFEAELLLAQDQV